MQSFIIVTSQQEIDTKDIDKDYFRWLFSNKQTIYKNL